MNYIARNLEPVVSQVTTEYPVVLLTGSRQVGKTTMLQKLMEGTGRRYISLDDLQERTMAKTDPELFLQLHKPPVLIDEVQYAPELFPYIKLSVDKNQTPSEPRTGAGKGIFCFGSCLPAKRNGSDPVPETNVGCHRPGELYCADLDDLDNWKKSLRKVKIWS